MFDFWLFKIAAEWKIDHIDGILDKIKRSSHPLHLSAADKASAITVLVRTPVVVWFLRWTVRYCDFKRVGDWLFPEQSRSWLRHSNPCAPNHTAVLSARGYNQGNTSKFSLWSWSAHMHAYNMGLVRTQTHSTNHSLIAHEYSVAWLIMKE